MKRCVLLADHARRVVKLTPPAALRAATRLQRLRRSLCGQVWAGVLAFAFAQMASAVTTFYVTTNGTGNLSGSDWANATNDLQGAIDAIETGAANTVWVSNGVYQTGGRTNYPTGGLLTNRVVINKIITVRSANNDPTNTIIKGAWDTATNGPAAVRCVYMISGSSLIGFMLTNGATLLNADSSADGGNIRGGGMHGGGTLSNCIVTGNSAKLYGGGVYRNTSYNCTIVGNHAEAGGGACYSVLYNCTLSRNWTVLYDGGGAMDCNMYNCLLIGNSARRGAGAVYDGTQGKIMANCTVVGNQASQQGGGVRGADAASLCMTNCTIYFNYAPAGSNWYSTVTFINCCTTPTNDTWTAGNTTNDPLFIANGSGYGTNNFVAGNYRLQANSPCVNTGTNGSWTTTYPSDLDGRIRVRYGTVDMGAYECIYEGTIFSFR